MPTKRAGKDDEADNPTARPNMVWLGTNKTRPRYPRPLCLIELRENVHKGVEWSTRWPLRLIARANGTSITYMDPIPDEQVTFAVKRSKSLIRLAKNRTRSKQISKMPKFMQR